MTSQEIDARLHIGITAALNHITIDEALDKLFADYEFDGLEMGLYMEVAELMKKERST